MAYITYDEKVCLDKRTMQTMLVKASDLRDAVKRTDRYMEGTMADYELAAVQETAIMDVYFYQADGDEQKEA